MNRRLLTFRTFIVLLMIATLPQPNVAKAGCGITGTDPDSGSNFFSGCCGVFNTEYSCCSGGNANSNGSSGNGYSWNASASLPISGQDTSASQSSCSSCGSSGRISPNSLQGTANQLYRVWMPERRTEQSSFAPGMFSQFDSKLQISQGTGGTSISYLNAARQDSFYLVDGLNGDALDGIFHDQQRAVAREIKMVNASGTTVTDPVQATKFITTLWSGAKEEFEMVDLDPAPTTVNYIGRLTKQIDLTGRQTVVTYKTWTPAEITASPSRQWQINNITDGFTNSLTFTYDSTQHSGRWCVSQIARNDGATVGFTYNSTNLTSVQFADSSVATYTYSQNTTNNTTVITTSDVMNPKLTGTYELANNYSGSSNQTGISYTVPGRMMQKSNLSGELIWKHVLPVNAATDQLMIINAGSAYVSYGNGGSQRISSYTANGGGGAEIKRKSSSRYVSAAYSIVFVDYDTTLDTTVYGTNATPTQINQWLIPSETDSAGIQKLYEYDADGNRNKVTYTADSTFEKFKIGRAHV